MLRLRDQLDYALLRSSGARGGSGRFGVRTVENMELGAGARPSCCSLLAAAKGMLWGCGLCASEATAILVCGGEPVREEFAARMASTTAMSRVDLIVSSGMYRRLADFDPANSSNPHRIAMRGVDFPSLRQRLRLDRSAVDTVGNFTTTVGLLRELGHTHIILVTSAYHMRRASTCAAIVLGSFSISFTTVACQPAEVAGRQSWSRSQRHNHRPWWRALWCCSRREGARTEGWVRTARDAFRCVFWVLTGCDGASFARWVHPHRH